MNILTFDIEEWSLNRSTGSLRMAQFAEYDRLLGLILDLLEGHDIRATFFCLGKIAADYPDVVRRIAARGHEIGCHSHEHRWVNKMPPAEFREDTRSAVFAIEDLIGKKVKSFRAPAFSIGENCKWAFEILAENGIENDASVFPGVRDFGGFPGFTEQQPCIIDHGGIRINEFPIPLYSIPLINKQIAYSGGGYFRLLPLEFVKRQMKKSDYNMCYFHIDDLLTEKRRLMSKAEFEGYFKEPGTFKSRYLRYFKANVGRGNALRHLEKLLDTFNFMSIAKYCELNPFGKTVKI